MLKSILFWLYELLIGRPPRIYPDTPKEVAPEQLPGDRTNEVGKAINSTLRPWYLTNGMKELLNYIYKHEGGKRGYNADYGNNNKWILERYTFDQVRTLSRSQVTSGEASSAIGNPQFLTKTLDSLKKSLNLSGSEMFTPTLQDDLAVALMIRRGLFKYLRNQIGTHTFCNELAKEWASLPVVTGTKKGKSYYAGDGLNKSFHSVDSFLAVVDKMGKELRARMPANLK